MKPIKIITGILAITLIACCIQITNAQTKNDGPYKIELKDYAVYKVQSKKNYQYADKENKIKESKTAYLVKFSFTEKMKVMNTAVNFYIGDYKIKEYGGTADGIYFRIIDPSLIDSLNKLPMSYQIANTERISLKKNFIMPDTKRMKTEDEETVLKQNK